MAIIIPDLFPIQKIYQDAGFSLRYVGGCVRDSLLGLLPHDYDLATPMPATQGLILLKQHGYTVIPTGMDHGTFTLVINKQPYEITTLRRDVTTDGRRATISHTEKWEEDAARRDFTINALYMDFDGTLYDYADGLTDLNSGTIRFIGNAEDRIQEDYLRILRFFRFHERFSKQPISAALKATFTKFAPQLQTLSVERITQEFFLLLASKAPYEELIIMDECQILPQFLASYNLENFHNLLKAELIVSAPDNFLRRFVALNCNEHKLRLSNKEKSYLTIIGKLQQQIHQESLHYLAYRFGLSKLLDVCLLRNEIDRWQHLHSFVIPPFPLDGHDLTALGITKGPAIGKALRYAEKLWCESAYALTKKQLSDKIREDILPQIN
ncbi:CCA tRNA nucleotidyltransferase [Candidatus Odyssella acanthamoebae]|uniref:CCA tRNA nucleotidyltransferase n=1 Tax=Candidatus Odyssella acanthamoebae TaxID=91604 RepID=UPI00094B73E6|nr:CCA tRNA nucleotidyltransferase [Candidatus Paracaedibacter acanthamoebae]